MATKRATMSQTNLIYDEATWRTYLATNGLNDEADAWMSTRATELRAVDKYRSDDARKIALADAMRRFPVITRRAPKKSTKTQPTAPVANVVIGGEEIQDVDDTPEDINGAVRWVFSNMSRIIKRHADGSSEISSDALSRAPYNSCVGLAEFAATNPTDFHRLYVSRLLVKDQPQQADKSAEEMDPELSQLAEILREHGLLPNERTSEVAVPEVGGDQNTEREGDD